MALFPRLITDSNRIWLSKLINLLSLSASCLALLVFIVGIYMSNYLRSIAVLTRDNGLVSFIGLLYCFFSFILFFSYAVTYCGMQDWKKTRSRTVQNVKRSKTKKEQIVYLSYFQINEIIILIYVVISPIVFIVSVAHVDKVEEGFENGLLESMKDYGHSIDQKTSMDQLQIYYQCCGAKSYKSWLEIPDGRKRIPFSCCYIDYIGPCENENLTQNGVKSLNSRGCASVFSFYVASTLSFGAALWFMLCIILAAASIFHRYFYTSVKNALINFNDPFKTAYGWILASSPLAALSGGTDADPAEKEKLLPPEKTQTASEGVEEKEEDETDMEDGDHNDGSAGSGQEEEEENMKDELAGRAEGTTIRMETKATDIKKEEKPKVDSQEKVPQPLPLPLPVVRTDAEGLAEVEAAERKRLSKENLEAESSPRVDIVKSSEATKSTIDTAEKSMKAVSSKSLEKVSSAALDTVQKTIVEAEAGPPATQDVPSPVKPISPYTSAQSREEATSVVNEATLKSAPVRPVTAPELRKLPSGGAKIPSAIGVSSKESVLASNQATGTGESRSFDQLQRSKSRTSTEKVSLVTREKQKADVSETTLTRKPMPLSRRKADQVSSFEEEATVTNYPIRHQRLRSVHSAPIKSPAVCRECGLAVCPTRRACCEDGVLANLALLSENGGANDDGGTNEEAADNTEVAEEASVEKKARKVKGPKKYKERYFILKEVR